jgi:hypothetical protein
MALTLTGVPVIYLTVRSAFKGADRDQLLIISLFTVFGAMFTSYWVIVTGRFTEVIGWVLFSSPAASGLQSSSYLVSRYGDIQELTLQSVPFFLDSFHYAFLLAMTATGLTMLWRSGQLSRLRWRIVVIGAAPAAVLYFPNPLWLPLEGLLELSRWRLMLLPFLLLLPAVGLRYGMRGGRGGRLTTRRVLTVVLTAGLLFTTVTSGVSHGSITDVANLQKEPQEYLTNEELAATEFVYAHLDDDEDVHSRSDLDTYMEEYAIPRGYPYPESRFKTLTASARTNHVLVEPGLTVMSVGAFEREGVRVDIVELDPSQYPEGASVNTPIFSSTHSWDRTAGSVVYSSGAVVIQHRHRDQANESTAVR